MIVPPGPSHATGIDVVRNDVAVICELTLAEGTSPILSDDLLIKQLPHFGLRPKFPVSPGVMWILDSSNAQLSNRALFWNSFSPTAKARTMNWADLVATESHRFFLFGFEVFCFGFVRLPIGRVVAD
jgi:hypothetical protein